MSVGATLKFIREVLVPEAINDLEEGRGDTFAVDIGLLVQPWPEVLRVGMALQNVGPDMKFEAARAWASCFP